MSLLDQFAGVLDALRKSGIQEERMALARDRLEDLREKLIALEEENARLVEENRALHEELERARVPEDFVSHRGVLFRRLTNGDYEDTVYCPRCKGAMFSLMDATPFKCAACGTGAGFNGRRLHDILRELKAAGEGT